MIREVRHPSVQILGILDGRICRWAQQTSKLKFYSGEEATQVTWTTWVGKRIEHIKTICTWVVTFELCNSVPRRERVICTTQIFQAMDMLILTIATAAECPSRNHIAVIWWAFKALPVFSVLWLAVVWEQGSPPFWLDKRNRKLVSLKDKQGCWRNASNIIG